MQHHVDETIRSARATPFDIAADLMDKRTALERVADAIERRRVCVAYQPIVNATNFQKLLAFEVLVRIIDKNGQLISADQFIDLIENDELGRVIDAEVLQICIKKLSQNRKLALSLNVSARSIGHPPWRTALVDAVRRDQTIGKRLILEFTEQSVNIVPEYVTMLMREMRSTGILFALDRFGSGPTTFHTFKRFMFDIVKFDSEMTQGTLTCSDTEVLVNGLIDFSHNFDMGVVIDRIETEEQMKFFRSMKADFFQGYLFGEPKLQK